MGIAPYVTMAAICNAIVPIFYVVGRNHKDYVRMLMTSGYHLRLKQLEVDLIEKMGQKISFLHSGLPNCTSPIVSHIVGYPEYPFMHGTGFFARKGNALLFITARHCLTKSGQDDVPSIASRLQIPYKLSGYKSHRGDFVEFDSIYQFKSPLENSPDDYVDFVILTIKVTPKSWQDKHMRSRAAKLPPTGEWLEIFTRHQIVEQALLTGTEIPLVAVGYPHEGTLNGIDDNGGIIVQRVLTSGFLRNGTLAHTMYIDDIKWDHDIGGFSGSPIFLRYTNQNGIQYALVGMIILGSHKKAHFIPISLITGSKFDPPLDFDFDSPT